MGGRGVGASRKRAGGRGKEREGGREKRPVASQPVAEEEAGQTLALCVSVSLCLSLSLSLSAGYSA